ncbi:MAG TPA: hypothetical protein VLQ45_08240 [Thermoanaerobaculia bacterium]|nr:hypothetical protein [Thermoanaerobaculia bacterium]
MKILEIVPLSLGGRMMPKKIVRSGWALALLAALVPGISAATTLHDGVVVDFAKGAAYLASPEGGIDAVQLSTGNVIWKTRDAAKPLLVKDGALLAQGRPGPKGELTLVTLDTRQGAAKSRAEVALEGVRANLKDGPSQTFRAEAFVAADKSVVVTWVAEEPTFRGMVPAPEDGLAPAKSAAVSAGKGRSSRGAVRVDMAQGRAVPMAFEKAQSLEGPALALRAEGIRVRGLGTTTRELTSLDGQHVLKSERNPEGGLWTPYRWTVTDKSGRVIGTANAPVSLTPFLVSGTRILYMAMPSVRKEGDKIVDQPLRLVSMDLLSGTDVWDSEVVDSNYRGPFPP